MNATGVAVANEVCHPATYQSPDRESRLGEICRHYGLAELALFGSAARGELEPGSDIDLLYVPNPDAHLGWRIEELAEDLSTLYGRPVDLVSKRNLHELPREQILHDARILYAA